MSHWQKTDPARYQAIADKQAFFTQLGEQAELEIQALESAIAGPDPQGEGYLEKVGRLNMARLAAEEQILPELILVLERNQLVRERAELHRKLDGARANVARLNEQRVTQLFPNGPGPTKR